MSKKLTINEIKHRVKNIFGDKYEIPEQPYIDSFTKIIVNCNIHSEFIIEPRHLLSGHGCSKCSKTYKYTMGELENEYIQK